MPALRRLLALCAIALAAGFAAAAPAAAATPQEIFQDYAFNQGAIAGDYSFEDLRGALQEVAGDPFYANFAAAVEAKLDSAYLGRSESAGTGELIGGERGESALPVPRTPDQSGDPPWPFLALTILAGALVVTGAGSSIYRRARR